MLDKNKVKLGIAPIAWTNDDMPDLGSENTFEQCISEMALAGFTGCEVGNKYPRDDIPALKKALSLRNMQICNAWFSSFLLTKPYDEVEKDFTDHISFLKEMGAKVVGISEQSYSIQGTDKSVFKDKYIMNDDEWARLCDGVNRLGKVAKDMGISLTYHHHMGKELKIPTIEAEIRIYKSEDDVLLDLLESNIRRRGEIGDSAKKVGKRIKELERLYGIQNGGDRGNQYKVAEPNNSALAKSQSDLATQMGISVDTLQNYKMLADMIAQNREKFMFSILETHD